ncbi:MAG: penicillin acylase family protein, partial [Myxococcota bacterium]
MFKSRSARLLLLTLIPGAGFVGCDNGSSETDAGGIADSGVHPDASEIHPDAAEPDSGNVSDTGVLADTGVAADSGVPADSGVVTPPDLRIPGLTATVSVSFDDFGVTHISCQTDADCFAAEGYYHAAHRFAQMDLRRRFVRGTLSELMAFPPIVDQDYSARLFLATPDGQDLASALIAQASPETRAMLDAYTRGVNAWIQDLQAGRNGAKLSDEWQVFHDFIRPWEPVDSVAGIIALVASLTNSTSEDIDRGMAAAAMQPQEFFDLYGVMPASRAAALDPVRTSRRANPLTPEMLEQFRAVQSELALANRALEQAKTRIPPRSDLITEGFGSNNWVVNPSMAADHTSAYLANDPHLGLTNPATWYLVSIDSRSAHRGGRIHVAGASFAGMPGIILGQNEDIAWGATTTYFDQADVYLEQLAPDGSGVIRNGNTVPFVQRTFQINQITFTGNYRAIERDALYVPGHGPVLSLDLSSGTAVTARWTGHTLSTDINFPWDIMTASSEAEAKSAFRDSTSIGQNFVVVDRAGNTGWYPFNFVPNRPWATVVPPFVPVPGDGRFEWNGSIAEADLPQAHNPVGGFVATANSDMTGQLYDGNPFNEGRPYIQSGVDPGYRLERIQDRLRAGTGTHNLSTMQDIQNDIVSLPGTLVTPVLLRAATAGAANLNANGQEVQRALAGWAHFSCPTGLNGQSPSSPFAADATEASESIGCTAFHVVLGQLYGSVFADEIARRGVTVRPNIASLFIQILTPQRLLNPGGYWDDVSTVGTVETSTQAYVNAMNAAGDWLSDSLGAARDQWRWGRIHTVSLSADFFSSAGNTSYDSTPYCAQGGLFTVNVANPNDAQDHDYRFGSGPSMRFSCEANAA